MCHKTFSSRWAHMITDFTILFFSQGGPFKSRKDICALLWNMIKWELNLTCLQYTQPPEVCSGNNNNNQNKTNKQRNNKNNKKKHTTPIPLAVSLVVSSCPENASLFLPPLHPYDLGPVHTHRKLAVCHTCLLKDVIEVAHGLLTNNSWSHWCHR